MPRYVHMLQASGIAFAVLMALGLVLFGLRNMGLAMEEKQRDQDIAHDGSHKLHVLHGFASEHQQGGGAVAFAASETREVIGDTKQDVRWFGALKNLLRRRVWPGQQGRERDAYVPQLQQQQQQLVRHEQEAMSSRLRSAAAPDGRGEGEEQQHQQDMESAAHGHEQQEQEQEQQQEQQQQEQQQQLLLTPRPSTPLHPFAHPSRSHAVPSLAQVLSPLNGDHRFADFARQVRVEYNMWVAAVRKVDEQLRAAQVQEWHSASQRLPEQGVRQPLHQEKEHPGIQKSHASTAAVTKASSLESSTPLPTIKASAALSHAKATRLPPHSSRTFPRQTFAPTTQPRTVLLYMGALLDAMAPTLNLSDDTTTDGLSAEHSRITTTVSSPPFSSSASSASSPVSASSSPGVTPAAAFSSFQCGHHASSVHSALRQWVHLYLALAMLGHDVIVPLSASQCRDFVFDSHGVQRLFPDAVITDLHSLKANEGNDTRHNNSSNLFEQALSHVLSEANEEQQQQQQQHQERKKHRHRQRFLPLQPLPLILDTRHYSVPFHANSSAGASTQKSHRARTGESNLSSHPDGSSPQSSTSHLPPAPRILALHQNHPVNSTFLGFPVIVHPPSHNPAVILKVASRGPGVLIPGMDAADMGFDDADFVRLLKQLCLHMPLYTMVLRNHHLLPPYITNTKTGDVRAYWSLLFESLILVVPPLSACIDSTTPLEALAAGLVVVQPKSTHGWDLGHEFQSTATSHSNGRHHTTKAAGVNETHLSNQGSKEKQGNHSQGQPGVHGHILQGVFAIDYSDTAQVSSTMRVLLNMAAHRRQLGQGVARRRSHLPRAYSAEEFIKRVRDLIDKAGTY